MVYTNGLSSPNKGARKLAHGGSGIPDHGDSYGPGGNFQSLTPHAGGIDRYFSQMLSSWNSIMYDSSPSCVNPRN